MMLLYPRRWLRKLKPTFFMLICIGALILLRNLAYDSSVYQSISLHQKMEYQIFSSFYQKDESVRRVFRKKVAHLNELGLSNVHDNIPVQDDIVCRHPKLDISNDANKAAFFDVGSIQCYGRELFTFENGVLRFNRMSLRGDVIKKCSYQAVERIDDNYETYTIPLTRNSSPFDMVLQHDFIRVQCYFEIEEHTEYQRNLLSVNLQHGKHRLSVPKRQAEKISLQNGVPHGESKNGILQPIRESGTIRPGKKMAQHLKQSSFTLPLIPKESGLKHTSHQKLAKNGTVLTSPEIEDVKNPNQIININQSTFTNKNYLNILQNQLQESGAKERILQLIQQPKSLKNPKKVVKESEHSVFAIPNPLSIEKHQLQKFNQLRLANHDVAKKGIFDSRPNPRSIKNSNKSIEIPKPPIFGQLHPNFDKGTKHSANNNIIKSSGKLFRSQDNRAKNMPNARVLANKTKPHSLYAISNSNIRVGHHGQRPNSSQLVQRMTKSQQVKKIRKNKKNIQLSSALSKQKSVPNKSLRQRTGPQLSNINHLKNTNLKALRQRTGPQLSNINPLKNTNLKALRQRTGPQLSNINPLKNTNLKAFRQRTGPQLSNINPLKNTNLKALRQRTGPQLSNINHLKNTNLKALRQRTGPQLSNINHLKNTNLKALRQRTGPQLSNINHLKNTNLKALRQRTGPQLSNINHLKNTNLKEIYKLVGNSNLNRAIPAFKNIGSKKNISQKNKKVQILFREVWKHGPYPVKRKEMHLSKGGRFEAIYLKPSLLQKSQPLKISRKGNTSLWQNGVWPFVKPIHKYFKKIPTHLAQLPELKQQNNIQSINKNTNLSLKISSTKQSPAKSSDVPQLILVPKVIPPVSQPVSVAAGHYETNYDMIKTSTAKSGTKISHSNATSQSNENQVPPFPLTAQTDQTFDIFAIKHKSSEGKKNVNANDFVSYDSSREIYINLPPEDYGINEELPDIEQFFVQIYPKPEVFQRISEVPQFVRINVIPLNILIYGLDSLSHLSFQRKLPLTYKHLKDSLNAVIMNGYNIVGDATTAAIIPLLTGKTETELPEVRKNQLTSGFVDDYPLIWNKFRSKGYATLFAEDSPSLAVFNLRFNGFYTVPTDHYMRPFWQAVSESVLHERSLNFCLGSKPKHQFTLDYVKDFFQKYNNVSKFAFAFHGELSHNDNNPVQYLDKDFLHFLQEMQQHNFLNNTLLIIMSDHGARYSNVRNTVQGKLEERLPFMSFVFPPWFHKKYPYFMNNLKGNQEKLVTPFDVHETMLDLLDTSRMYEPVDYSTRGISLLQSVPLNRTCRSAGIAMHWCSCLTRFDVNPSTPLVQMSLHKILSYIRTLLLPVKHLCAELSLKKIIYAYLVTPNEKVLKFTNSKDADNRVANFSQQMLLDTVHYQLTFETYPNGGLYEASVQVDIRKESFQVFPEISRLNKYGEQPSCIKEIFPDLRKYCYCKRR